MSVNVYDEQNDRLIPIAGRITGEYVEKSQVTESTNVTEPGWVADARVIKQITEKKTYNVNDYLTIEKTGNVVVAQFLDSAQQTYTINAWSTIDIGLIPEECRPSHNIANAVFVRNTVGGASVNIVFQITPDGRVQLWNIASNQSVSVNQVFVNLTWAV